MGKIGKYIYGIIPRLRSEEVNSKSQELFDPYTKDFGVGVYTIPYRDTSAVVSDSEIVDYTRMLKDAVARLLVRHQKVI
jgi:hypothetical protein